MLKSCQKSVESVFHEKRKEGTEEFQKWWEEYQHQCHSNFKGSSGGAAGCVAIFEGSVEQYMACDTQSFLEMRTVKHSI